MCYHTNMWCFFVIMVNNASTCFCILCPNWCRSLRYRVCCVMVVLVELRYIDYTNKWSSPFDTTYIYKDFNGGYTCVLIVRVRNCECIGTKLKQTNVYLSNKFQRRLSNWNFHLLPIHRFPGILIATEFLIAVKISRYYRYPNVCISKKQWIEI